MKEETVLTCAFSTRSWKSIESSGEAETKTKCIFVTPNNVYEAYLYDGYRVLDCKSKRFACVLYVYKKYGVKLVFDDDSADIWKRENFGYGGDEERFKKVWNKYIGKDQIDCPSFWLKFRQSIGYEKNLNFDNEIVKKYLSKEICK